MVNSFDEALCSQYSYQTTAYGVPYEHQTTASAQGSWDNRKSSICIVLSRCTTDESPVLFFILPDFAAFGGQNVDQIMEDYDDSSTLVIYDFTAPAGEELSVNVGLDAIRGVFTGLFGALNNYDQLSAPVVDTSTDDDFEGPNTFLVWNCPGCNDANYAAYSLVTDTFTYDTSTQCLVSSSDRLLTSLFQFLSLLSSYHTPRPPLHDSFAAERSLHQTPEHRYFQLRFRGLDELSIVSCKLCKKLLTSRVGL